MKERSYKTAEDTTFEDIKQNYLNICENLFEAMDKANRKDKVWLMAVTKTVPVEKINYALDLGIDLIGENRVQEFLSKYEGYKKGIETHFIGGLQSNKVKYIIDKVDMIHSVDSERLAREINTRAAKCGRVMDILLEINIGQEESKSGLLAGGFIETAKIISEMENIRIRGLMCIPPVGSDESYFAKMQELYENGRANYSFLKDMDTLSMGMSGDYESAIKYGSTIIRIGSGLFGYRNYSI